MLCESGRPIVNSHRPTRRNSSVELSRGGRCELTITNVSRHCVRGGGEAVVPYGMILPEIILEQIATPRLMTAAHNRSIVFTRWRQCARPSNTWFIGPTRHIISNIISIKSAVIREFTVVTDGQTDRMNMELRWY